MKHLGDITKINGSDVPLVNVVIGGSPCQDLSIAGRRAGLAGERSGLFIEQIRIIKEMRTEDIKRGRKSTDIRPRYMVWENVPGAFSSNRGQDFKAVLEETIGIVKKVKPDIPIPKGGWHYSGVIMGNGFSIAWRVFDAQFWGVPQRRRRIALVADFGGESAPEILFERKGVSRYSPPGRTPWKDFAAAIAKRFRAADKRVQLEQTSNYGILNDQFVFAIDRATFNQEINAQYDFEVSGSGINSTLTAKGASAVCGAFNANMGGKAHGIGYEEEKSPTLSAARHDAALVTPQQFVRRLTPLECERLQGFPDGWTDIGDYIDSDGKKRKTSDTSRYKALGNSIALPSWVWVLERLSYCCEADRTMASLFDGIGGFPLIWETLNGEGTCLWASEIEEFPIAVTQYHFKED